ncbi:MAG: helix-turn-helix domain-containing protein [Conexivisphaerales archaeon]
MRSEVLIHNEGKTLSTEITVLKKAENLKDASDEISLSILRLASTAPVHAREIAKRIGVRDQTVYYHVRKLLSIGLLRVAGVQQVRGASAKTLSTTSNGVAYIFDWERCAQAKSVYYKPELHKFLSEYIEDTEFKGFIIVGSPEPHGSFRASARDGHYAVQLALEIGAIAHSGTDFIVKLDTDAKLEMSFKHNIILIGGPATNMITADVNRNLPVRFDETNYWAGLIDNRGRRYNFETDAMIAKIPNPFEENKKIVVIAGIRHIGTKAAIIGLTQQTQEVLRGYEGREPFVSVVRGFDQDGDGKVDSVDVIATYSE